jgi:tetratricopeptide (TPR) repeat protein
MSVGQPATGEVSLSPTLRESIDRYRSAVMLSPSDSGFLNNLCARARWFDKALCYLRQAAAYDRKAGIYNISLGLLLEHLSEPNLAREQYIAAINADPAILDSQFYAEYARRNPADSKVALAAAVAMTKARAAGGKDAIAVANLGSLYLHTGQTNDAVQCLNAASARLPNLPMPWINLAIAQRASGLSQGFL